MRWPLSSVLLPMLLCAQAAGAQLLFRGVVAEAGAGPVGSATVSLSDSLRRVIGVAQTDDGGGFTLRIPAGVYVLRVQRIGLQPIIKPVTVTGAEPDLVLEMQRIVVNLAAVVVTAQGACESWFDTTSAAYIAFEHMMETETAMRADYAVHMVMISWQLGVARGMGKFVSLNGSPRFALLPSVEADTLHARGYILGLAGDARGYFFPDLETVTSSWFIADHCVSARKDGDEFVVEFTPRPERRMPEVQVKLVIEGRSYAPKMLEFQYRNVDVDTEAVRAAEFEYRTSNGRVLIDWLHAVRGRAFRP